MARTRCLIWRLARASLASMPVHLFQNTLAEGVAAAPLAPPNLACARGARPQVRKGAG